MIFVLLVPPAVVGLLYLLIKIYSPFRDWIEKAKGRGRK
jgi:hypothetical protein